TEAGRAARHGDARPRPDATGHWPARRQGGAARAAALLGAFCAGPALRRAGAARLAGAAAAGGSLKPYCYVPVTQAEEEPWRIRSTYALRRGRTSTSPPTVVWLSRAKSVGSSSRSRPLDSGPPRRTLVALALTRTRWPASSRRPTAAPG